MIRPRLTLLGREYCHLCEEMLAGLKQFQARYDFDIEHHFDGCFV